MPQIPTVVAPQTEPIPEMSPGIAGRPGEAMSQLGGAVEYVADRIVRARERLALLTAENQSRDFFNKYQETLAQSGDPDHLPDAQKQFDSLKDRFLKDPRYADPRIQRELGPEIDALGVAANHLTEMRRLTLQRQQFDAQLGILATDVAFEMAQAPDAEHRGLARAAFEKKAAEGVAHGWITPVEQEAKLKALDATAQEVEITNAIDKNDPVGIERMIEKTEQHPEAFKDINPKHFAVLKEKLRDQLTIARNRMHAQQAGAAAGQLQATYGSDYSAMLSAIKDPDTQKSLGLVDEKGAVNIEAVDKLRSYIAGQDAIDKKTRADGDTAALDKYWAEADSLKLSEPAIDHLEQQYHQTNGAQGISPHVAAQLKSVRRSAITLARSAGIEARRERQEAANAESDRIAGELAARINDFEYLTKHEIYSHVPKLKWQDAQHLVAMSEAMVVMPAETKSALTSANKIIDGSIAPPKGIGLPATAEQLKRADEAKTELLEWVQAQDKMIKSGTRKELLTTKEIHDKAQEIIPQYIMTIKDQLEAMHTQMTGQPARPANVPANYVFKENGPKGRGWYKP